ncbi:hypothetical protein PTSG_10041 [Salpingoeca rosetta]|uniref:Uncharacterized protein n=1 Tax=Salpingoeca rosetta (strain ATCC 50818 / BSB-021) TaxID=946362 RepID=F2UPC1_SALR5|nr:uncharacterized protein PTSG_10041 [Salpingoeca rosetta]EGD79476.1 hypothetical protein PTSG_10041 [Salpingoeca rosetta]|eukprot:XP_004988957.1 hypothetical protein PTSG_10041 [Salpingoeca rosetta]
MDQQLQRQHKERKKPRDRRSILRKTCAVLESLRLGSNMENELWALETLASMRFDGTEPQYEVGAIRLLSSVLNAVVRYRHKSFMVTAGLRVIAAVIQHPVFFERAGQTELLRTLRTLEGTLVEGLDTQPEVQACLCTMLCAAQCLFCDGYSNKIIRDLAFKALQNVPDNTEVRDPAVRAISMCVRQSKVPLDEDDVLILVQHLIDCGRQDQAVVYDTLHILHVQMELGVHHDLLANRAVWVVMNKMDVGSPFNASMYLGMSLMRLACKTKSDHTRAELARYALVAIDNFFNGDGRGLDEHVQMLACDVLRQLFKHSGWLPRRPLAVIARVVTFMRRNLDRPDIASIGWRTLAAFARSGGHLPRMLVGYHFHKTALQVLDNINSSGGTIVIGEILDPEEADTGDGDGDGVVVDGDASAGDHGDNGAEGAGSATKSGKASAKESGDADDALANDSDDQAEADNGTGEQAQGGDVPTDERDADVAIEGEKAEVEETEDQEAEPEQQQQQQQQQPSQQPQDEEEEEVPLTAIGRQVSRMGPHDSLVSLHEGERTQEAGVADMQSSTYEGGIVDLSVIRVVDNQFASREAMFNEDQFVLVLQTPSNLGAEACELLTALSVDSECCNYLFTCSAQHLLLALLEKTPCTQDTYPFLSNALKMLSTMFIHVPNARRWLHLAGVKGHKRRFAALLRDVLQVAWPDPDIPCSAACMCEVLCTEPDASLETASPAMDAVSMVLVAMTKVVIAVDHPDLLPALSNCLLNMMRTQQAGKRSFEHHDIYTLQTTVSDICDIKNATGLGGAYATALGHIVNTMAVLADYNQDGQLCVYVQCNTAGKLADVCGLVQHGVPVTESTRTSAEMLREKIHDYMSKQADEHTAKKRLTLMKRRGGRPNTFQTRPQGTPLKIVDRDTYRSPYFLSR